jgi:hypothetical protein
MSIENFSGWSSLNEGVTPEQAEKVFAEAEKWSKATGIEIETDTKGLTSWMGSTYIWVRDLFGLWQLNLEKSTKKGGQDDMWRQTYQRSDENKWYITYPGRWSQYDSRGRTKPGNFKSFKAIIEEFMEVKKVFDKVSFFFENALGIKKIDTTHYQNSNGEYVVTLQGKDLKSLTAYCGSLGYSREKKWENIDPTKVEVLHRILSTKNYEGLKFRKPVEEAGKNFDYILEILEILKEEPLDKFLEDTKSGNWEEFQKNRNYSGKVVSKKYGL